MIIPNPSEGRTFISKASSAVESRNWAKENNQEMLRCFDKSENMSSNCQKHQSKGELTELVS
jgi:hypothetical protein